jgi:hypothetical protein
VTWTRITDPEQAEGPLSVWFSTRMLGLRGKFGLVLTTGDVLRITCINALHESPHGVILLDVLLDHAGIPDGVDQAWQRKHYLGAPVPGATMATVNFAHDEIDAGRAPLDPLAEPFERNTSEIAPQEAQP